MNERFLTLLSLSVSGSLVALLLLLLKPVLKNRLSKTWQYYILLVVVFRFLLPFGPDTSLMGAAFRQVAKYASNINASAALPHSEQQVLSAREADPRLRPNEDLIYSISVSGQTGQPPAPRLWLMWLVPLSLLFRKIISYHNHVRSVKRECAIIADARVLEIYHEACAQMDIKHPPVLAKNNRVPAPVVAGMIQPMIVLPDTEFIDSHMRYILQHELTHYKRMDIVYKWLVQIALSLHWFNPVIYWVSRETNRLCELSCDEAVIKRLNKKDKCAYGDMLLDAIVPCNRISRPAVSINLNEDGKLIKERLEAIMTYKIQSRKTVMLSAMLAALLLFGAACSGAYTAASQLPGDIPPVIEEAVNENGTIVPISSVAPNKAQPVSIDNVEMRYYENDLPGGQWPYVHWLITNISDKAIAGYEMVLLAYDESGDPLELIWWQMPVTDGYKVTGYTSQHDKSYDQLVVSSDPILPGETEDLLGGWSLWDGWDQENGTHEAAYILACMKQVVFDDGTIWENPDYQGWMTKYKAKAVGVDALAAYYA